MAVLPDRLRCLLVPRFRRHRNAWLPLYRDAVLRFAPRCTLELVPGDVISDSIAFSGIWELRLSRHLLHRARRGGVMIEVGANLGYFSVLWAAANANNRVIAFEASPRNVELLRRNVTRNNLGTRIQVIPCAASRHAGSLPFDLGPPDQTGWGGIAAAAGEGSIVVDVVRVDETIEGTGEIAFLKIDVEGADTWVLMGCERLLRERRITEIWFEQNKPRMRALGIGEAEAGDFLRSVGYELTPERDPSADVVDWLATPMFVPPSRTALHHPSSAPHPPAR
jgi:FkbM family methyltransferase